MTIQDIKKHIANNISNINASKYALESIVNEYNSSVDITTESITVEQLSKCLSDSSNIVSIKNKSKHEAGYFREVGIPISEKATLIFVVQTDSDDSVILNTSLVLNLK